MSKTKIGDVTSYRVLVFTFITLLLNFQIEQRVTIVPYAEHLVVGIQTSIAIFALFHIKLKTNSYNIIILVTWAILLLWSLMTGLWSEFQILTLQRTFFVFGLGLILLILVYSDNNPLKTFIRTNYILCYIGLFVSMYGLAVWFFGEIFTINGQMFQIWDLGSFSLQQNIRGFYQGQSSAVRISSLFGNPNRFAIMLIYTLVSTTTLFSLRKLTYKKFIVFMMVQMIALFLTSSRAGIVFALFAVALVLVFTKREIRTTPFKSIFILFSFIIISFAITINKDLFYSFFSTRSSLLAGREEAWAVGLEIFGSNPFHGLGFGVSSEVLNSMFNITITLHNLYIALLVELGIMGLLLFIFITFVAIFRGGGILLDYKVNSNLRKCIVSSLALITALTLYQFFEIITLRYSFFGIYWVYLIGFVTATIYRKD
ncbi:O-antigen ligase family protein [Proteinivorax tanatarense]|uniref:O-antigen ligase family protein n=1 Tax=Proteinivorax tanatarense TaxID=1260629 RepID=A0AAU7VHQ8_9FIRM